MVTSNPNPGLPTATDVLTAEEIDALYPCSTVRHEHTPSGTKYSMVYAQSGRYGLVGRVYVFFHSADSAMVRDDHALKCGAHTYKVTIHYRREGNEWVAEQEQGLPAVRRSDDSWTRPTPTIDRKIRDHALGALLTVIKHYPHASTDAEVDRLTRARDQARAVVEKLRTDLENAECVAADADHALTEYLSH